MTVASPRVLLISESRITRRVVEMTFADQQVDLVTAATGQDGLTAWADAPAAVVLADLAMDAPPDGLTIARHVQAQAGGRPVAVLLLAGQHDVVDEAEIAAAGVRGVIHKPLDSLQLIEAVRGAMRAASAPWAPAEPAVVAAVDTEPAAEPAPVAALVAAAEEPTEVSPVTDPPVADAFAERVPVMVAAEHDTPHPLRDEDLERVAARVAAIWSGDEARERRVSALVAERAEQVVAASATAAAERAAPAATSEVAERLVRELAPALVAEVARLVVADVSERLVREEIARMRATPATR
jgi:CheY-like chemotaxis protein